MSTLYKQFEGIFIPLSANDLALLCEHNELKDAYLDGISYMHDMVIQFSDEPFSPTFKSQDAQINCGNIKSKYFNNEDSLSQHFTYNFEVATYFANESEAILAANNFVNVSSLRRDTTAYIKALLYTYNIVRTTR